MTDTLDLQTIRDDIAYEERRFNLAARSPHDGRLCNPVALAAAQARRLDRIEELEAHEHALVSLQEASAELLDLLAVPA